MIDGELSDCEKYRTILKSHYKKFYLLYNAFLELNLVNNISSMKCDKVNKNLIYFIIDLDLEYNDDDFLYILKIVKDYLCEYLVDVDNINGTLTIMIKDSK